MLRHRARAQAVDTVRVRLHEPAEDVLAVPVDHRGETLHGVQEHVRVVILDRLHEDGENAGHECAVERGCRETARGRPTRGDELAQEEQTVRPDGEKGVLEEFEGLLVRLLWAFALVR